jgi:type VI secretion system protein ImpH
MATTDRPPPSYLEFLRSVAPELRRSGLFPILRAAEGRALDLPRIGTSRRPTQDVVSLAHRASLSFAESTLERVELRNGRAKVSGHWLGLTGPMGPLPSHLTEYALYERRYGKSQPFGDFLDMLAGRMLQLFYRVWADSQPAAMADRPLEDAFAAYLGIITGATEGVEADAVFPAKARLHYAALFASRRSAAGLEDALQHLLRQPVVIQEFQPRWRELEASDHSRLGKSFCRLGSDVILGRRVRTASDAFRVVARAQSFPEYETLLPTGPRFDIAAAALDAFAPSHLEWDLTIEIHQRQARPARLDARTRLGWTSWLGKRAGENRLRADAHLTKRARVRRNRIKGEVQ